MNRTAERHELPDGSVCVVEPIDGRSSLISRYVDGSKAPPALWGQALRRDEDGRVCVWGQAFSSGEDHEGQVAGVVQSMTADPDAFRQWWYTQ